MKKSVNGKIVDVDNIELFRLGAEGMALSKTAVSHVSDGIGSDVNSELLNRLIERYNMFLSVLPYPLYSIETDIKYCAIAGFLEMVEKTELHMWVKGGLYVILDEEDNKNDSEELSNTDSIVYTCLHLLNNTWGIVNILNAKDIEDNSDIDNFSNCVGYKEYSWILDNIENIIKRKPGINFYSAFMPKFLEACGNQGMVIKWELTHILEFGHVPKELDIADNKILDINKEDEFILDIYPLGDAETGRAEDTEHTWVLGSSKLQIKERTKKIHIYGYDLYRKSVSGKYIKSDKDSAPGIRNLFLALTGIKNATENSAFKTFRAILVDTNLIYEIDSNIYVCKSNRASEAKKIGSNVSIYGYDSGKVYILRDRKVSDKVTEKSVYSYGLTDGIIKLCKIDFVY